MQASNKWLLLADPEAGTLVSRIPRVVLVLKVFHTQSIADVTAHKGTYAVACMHRLQDASDWRLNFHFAHS